MQLLSYCPKLFEFLHTQVSPHLSVLKVPLNKKKLLKFLFSDINNNENIRTFNNSGYLHSL